MDQKSNLKMKVSCGSDRDGGSLANDPMKLQQTFSVSSSYSTRYRCQKSHRNSNFPCFLLMATFTPTWSSPNYVLNFPVQIPIEYVWLGKKFYKRISRRPLKTFRIQSFLTDPLWRVRTKYWSYSHCFGH